MPHNGYYIGYHEIKTYWASKLKVLVISDTHIGAPYADAQPAVGKLIETIGKQLSDGDTVVLNGDIFEQMHIPLNTKRKYLLEHAKKSLRSLIGENNGIKFHYNIGNHEAYKPFIDMLKQLSDKHENFSYSMNKKRIGNLLVAHGDSLIKGNPDRKEIKKHYDSPLNSRALRALHVAENAFSPVLSRHKFPLEDTFDKIIKTIEKDNECDGITDIVIGHIHEPNGISKYQHKNYNFHVTGTSIRGMKNNMLLFELDKSGKIESIDKIQSKKSGNFITILPKTFSDFINRNRTGSNLPSF